MKEIKKRVALFLCLLLTVPTVMGCLPMASLQAEAATPTQPSGYLSWVNGVASNYDASTGQFVREFTVEAGQNVPLNKMVCWMQYGSNGETDDVKYLDKVSGEKYISSKTAVATITNAGVMNTKKAGTTKVTITYKGVSTECTVTVVKKNALGSNSTKSKKVKAVKKQLDKYTKVTSANRYAISQKISELNYYMDDYLTYNGFKMEKNSYGYYGFSNKLVVPELLSGSQITTKMLEYTSKNNPVGTNSSKWVKIKSVSAKKNSKTFTINLKSKMNAAHIFAIKEFYSADDYKEKSSTAVFPIYLKDKKTGYRYRGWAVAKEKSSKLTVTMDYLKLKSKRTYQLIGSTTSGMDDLYGWTKGKTFKVK